MNSTRFSALILNLALAWAGVAFAQQPGLDAPVAAGAYLNGVMPTVAPGAATGWNAVNAFPNLTFVDPLWLTPVPGTNDLLLVGKNGQLWRFANDPATTQGQVVKVLEWVAKTQSSEDQGFYSLVFHPEFGQVGSSNRNYAYVCYNHKPALAGADENHSYWHVSRFTWLPASGTLDPASELVLIKQYDPDLWHNGGAMFFDNTGFLNITCGDGGDSGAGGGHDGALTRTQTLSGGFFSGMFRIDVNNDPAKSHAIRRQPLGPTPPAGWPASVSQGYGIPNDNPFLDPAGSILEEYCALGFRSPHAAHYDPVEDVAWVGDVGGGSREEMSRIVKASNAQWGYREGFIAGTGSPAVPPIGTETPPFFDYPRNVGTCIIGGMRYRGAKWDTQLGGKLLYGDHVRGRIWTTTIDPAGGAPVSELIVDGFHTGNKAGLANFCTDGAGEIYLMNLNGTNVAGGNIMKLESAGIATEPPQFLSQTGAFSNLATLAPAPGMVPYDVANPLWSDGAEKKRWIILPNNGSHNTADEDIAFSDKGNWVFPAGTVFVKHFEMATNENNPSQIKRLETRFLICTANGGKYGVTYKWNAAGTDAELLTTGLGEDYTITQAGGGSVTRHWDYPSRADCMLCHNTNAGQALGVRTAMLNMDFQYPSTGRTANQLRTFNSLGMFDRTLTATELENFIAARPLDDETAPVEHRVRSYLASNCSHCHQPGGTVDYFDARLGTAFSKQGLVNGIIQGHFSLPGGFYIKPGDPSLSATAVRLANVGNGAAMPPLAKNVVDQKAVDLLTSYVAGLNPSEFEINTFANARYVRLTALSEVNGAVWSSAAEFSILDDKGKAIPTAQLSLADFDSEETAAEAAPAIQAIDGNIGTFWHTSWSGAVDPQLPHHITVDLGSVRAIGGYVYTPRQDNQNGRIAGYQVDYSADGVQWTRVDSGTWTNDDVPKSYNGLVNLRKARCEIAGPAGPPNGNFDVTIAFDADVADFAASDIYVNGGSVTKLRGAGYYYVATIAPTSPFVAVRVPADVANNNLLGNLASNTLSRGTDVYGPVPVFTGLPSGSIVGGFDVGIHFNEPPVGFSMASLTAANALLSGLTGSGLDYTVHIEPVQPGTFSISISPAGVTDALGNPMTGPVSATFNHTPEALFAEAESGTLTGGMVRVNNAGSSGGSYVWLPEGGYAGNDQTLNTAHAGSYTFVLPRAGNWTLEGLLRSDSATSNSLWASVDGGTAYNWSTNDGQVGTGAFHWDALNSTSTSIALINATTNNGSFETLGGVTPTTLKATHWDTDPDGDVNNWTLWGSATGGPATAFNDSGTEVRTSAASHGSRIAFLQGGNAAFNLTNRVIAAGDVFTYSWDWVVANRPIATAQLAYQNGTSIVAITGTTTTPPATNARQLGIGMTWTVPAGHPAIGHPIAMTIRASGGYPEVDNFILTVQPAAMDPVILNLAAGTHTVTVYGREDGTRLDALRFTSERPLVALSAPPVSVGNGNISVGVSFSEPVTGLAAEDFSLAGASAVSLTGSGSAYTLTLAPSATLVTVSLPENRTADGGGNPNFNSNTLAVEVRSSFEQWAINAGLAGAGYQDDQDRDGISALAEFLLHLNPNSPVAAMFDPAAGPTGLPRVSSVDAGGGAQRLVIEFPRDSAAVAAGYRYIGQFSDDFQNWDDRETGVAVPMSGGWDHMTIEDPAPADGRPRRFARLKLVAP